jgi:UDP-glucose 4-epimerase
VVGLDDFSTGSKHNLAHATLQNAFTLVEGDIRDTEIVQQACRDCETIVHLAAVTKVAESVRHPQKYRDINVSGTQQVLAGAVAAEITRVVFTSSAAVYGTPQHIPISEASTPEPLSPYGSSKLEAEKLCQTTAADHNIVVPQLRLFNIFGPHQPVDNEAGVVSIFLDRARKSIPLTIYGDGNQTRDFVYIDDVVETIIRALTRANVPSVPINVGTGIPISILELAETVQELVPSCVPEIQFEPPRPGDIYHSVADITRLQKILAFTPQFRLRDGLERTCQRALDELNQQKD